MTRRLVVVLILSAKLALRHNFSLVLFFLFLLFLFVEFLRKVTEVSSWVRIMHLLDLFMIFLQSDMNRLNISSAVIVDDWDHIFAIIESQFIRVSMLTLFFLNRFITFSFLFSPFILSIVPYLGVLILKLGQEIKHLRVLITAEVKKLKVVLL